MAPPHSWRQAFFTERRLTSKLKHLVLERYVKESYHLGSAFTTVYYVDGFAGPGAYQRHGIASEKGSPLLIAELAQRIRSTSASFSIRCLNVEENRKFYDDLQSTLEPFVPDIVERNYHGTFADVLPDILKRLGTSPAFVFIDPFGAKGIPFAALRPLFQRTARTEVLITLHTHGISKKAGYFASADDPNLRKARTARRFTETLAAALDLPSNDLRGWWHWCVREGHGGTSAFEQRVLRHYLNILRGPTTRFKFSKAFPVFYYRPGKPPATGDPICFYLVFATQHKKGLYKINDRMVDALDHFYQDEYGLPLFPQFHERLDKARDAVALEEEILKRFTTGSFTIDDTKWLLMQEATFLIKGSGYRSAVMKLYRAGKLKKLDEGPITNEGTRFAVKPMQKS